MCQKYYQSFWLRLDDAVYHDRSNNLSEVIKKKILSSFDYRKTFQIDPHYEEGFGIRI